MMSVFSVFVLHSLFIRFFRHVEVDVTGSDVRVSGNRLLFLAFDRCGLVVEWVREAHRSTLIHLNCALQPHAALARFADRLVMSFVFELKFYFLSFGVDWNAKVAAARRVEVALVTTRLQHVNATTATIKRTIDAHVLVYALHIAVGVKLASF